MDQDAFRRLLASEKGKEKPGSSSGSWAPAQGWGSSKPAPTKSNEPAFKPRKVKKGSESLYRDRATERRTGKDNDFSKVESVLEDFKTQTAGEDASAVEEKRRYLGGDGEHSVLVKGLDFALLEQQRARLAESQTAQDDESLEQAFKESASTSSAAGNAGRKRTREEIIQELKNKRLKGNADAPEAKPVTTEDPLEEAKKLGKFRPIGAPVPSKSGKEKKVPKKKKKLESQAKVAQEVKSTQSPAASAPKQEATVDSPVSGSGIEPRAKASTPTLADEMEVDIFADAGEYEGIDFGEEEEETALPSGDVRTAEEASLPAQGWFVEPDDPPIKERLESRPEVDALLSTARKILDPQSVNGPTTEPPALSREPSPEIPQRLAPLASSSIPSIRDIIDADKELEAQEQRKARREKKKAGGSGGRGEKKKLTDEAKLDRDYKKLQSYERARS
ncbi:hypothetical protein SISSUDRAFT_1062409 [Sistotremastrum suecicum HHB10207 ss-3]|uniref:RED-like N-terminal domain-containing protein n=1 Tax=Sistotremastrum suecicum HHB10207 ss-3 TaxID=1314776 RepID=A0A166CXJ8_9AGAM|nr:hypothetical protein SISSUDRAFT_1062409 [Sistotremastrum suecicum HHB10207 ss-3]